MIVNKNNNSNELEYLHERSLLIINFMLNKGYDNPIMLHFKKVIENTYRKRNLKGLKTLSRDLNAWAKGLPKEDIEELEKMLKDKFDETLSGDKTTHKVVSDILIKEKIDNKNEYRVIHGYLLDISEGDPFFDRIFELEKLLDKASNI